MDILRKLCDAELPHALSYEWTDMSYLEVIAGNTAMKIFAFAVMMVLLMGDRRGVLTGWVELLSPRAQIDLRKV